MAHGQHPISTLKEQLKKDDEEPFVKSPQMPVDICERVSREAAECDHPPMR